MDAVNGSEAPKGSQSLMDLITVLKVGFCINPYGSRFRDRFEFRIQTARQLSKKEERELRKQIAETLAAMLIIEPDGILF